MCPFETADCPENTVLIIRRRFVRLLTGSLPSGEKNHRVFYSWGRGLGRGCLKQVPKLPDDDFAEAVRIAQEEFDKHRPEVVVGSSRGGAVAMSIHSGDARLVLLCPAWKKYGTAKTVKPGTVILHSRADDVVPFADSEELVKNSGLSISALIEVGGDHRLADPEPLRKMLEACEETA